MNYVLSQAANFIGALDQWTLNGTPVSGISNFGGLCCAVADNPVTGGPGYYNTNFAPVPLAAGTESNWDQIFVSPYSFAANSGGVDPDANGFTWAIELQVAQTPLPAALPLFAGGLGALGLLGWRRKRTAV
jgi:hypothetical protein